MEEINDDDDDGDDDGEQKKKGQAGGPLRTRVASSFFRGAVALLVRMPCVRACVRACVRE